MTTMTGLLWRGLADVPPDWPACAVTIGVFDGIHRGHAYLIERTCLERLPTVLVTFDPHPARVLGLPRDTAALSTAARRAELAHELGVDAVCVLPFTPALARMSPEEFVADVLVDTLHAVTVVVGANFTFGHRGAGTVDTLRALGPRYGFTAHGVDLLPADTGTCSSTHVRGCLRAGDVEAAAAALGRPHRVDGMFTDAATIAVPPGTALPAPGAYTGAVDDTVLALDVVGDTVVLRSPAGTPAQPVSVQFLGRS